MVFIFSIVHYMFKNRLCYFFKFPSVKFSCLFFVLTFIAHNGKITMLNRKNLTIHVSGSIQHKNVNPKHSAHWCKTKSYWQTRSTVATNKMYGCIVLLIFSKNFFQNPIIEKCICQNFCIYQHDTAVYACGPHER